MSREARSDTVPLPPRTARRSGHPPPPPLCSAPLASFDAVGQRRHHAVRPNRRFRPANLAVLGFCPLRSLRRHSRDGSLRHLWPFRIQLPTTLPSRRFCCPPPLTACAAAVLCRF